MPPYMAPSVERVLQLTSQLPKMVHRERELSTAMLKELKTALDKTRPDDWLAAVEGRIPEGLITTAEQLFLQGKTGLLESTVQRLYQTAEKYKKSGNLAKQLGGYILAVLLDLQQKAADQLSRLVQQISVIKLDHVRGIRKTYTEKTREFLDNLPDQMKDNRQAILSELKYAISDKIGGIDDALFNRLKMDYPHFSEDGLQTIYERIRRAHQTPVEQLNLFERWFRKLTQQHKPPGYHEPINAIKVIDAPAMAVE